MQDNEYKINFHFNGDVMRMHAVTKETLVGRIDSDADWMPCHDCPWTEAEIKRALADQVVALGDAWDWPIEQLEFAGITNHKERPWNTQQKT